jgi:uncharacterized protein (TIGR02118 family)
MPTKVTFIYDNPLDPEAFETDYDDQIALATSVPGVERIEASRVWPKEDGTPTPAHRMLDLYFSDYALASDAVTTPEAAALFGDVFQRATGGVRIVFAEVLDSFDAANAPAHARSGQEA